MSYIEILGTVSLLEIETITSNTISALVIEVSSKQTLDINSDFASNVVSANNVVGLDDYLSNFIDNYEIDGGSL